MSKFREDDFIINNDPDDDNYLFTGRVARPDNNISVQVELIDGTIRYWEVVACFIAPKQSYPGQQTASAGHIQPASPQFQVTDIVRIDEVGNKFRGQTGVIIKITGRATCDVEVIGANHIEAFRFDDLVLMGRGVAVPAGHATVMNQVANIAQASATAGIFADVGDYVKVCDPNHSNYHEEGTVTEYLGYGLRKVHLTSGQFINVQTDQLEMLIKPVNDPDAPKVSEEPFRHTDLGTDLSGDELMESIRSICGR